MVISVDGYPCFYKDVGKGEIVLFIHGNPDSANYWDDVVAGLSKNYRCIIPDLPGFGRSQIDEQADFSMEYAWKWLASFLDKISLDKEPLHLVVHDIGGFYGLPWAIEFPYKVKSICITNTIFFSDYKWHFWGNVWRTPLLGELSGHLINRWLYKVNLRRSSPTLSDEYLNKGYQVLRANPQTQKTILKVYRAMSPSVFKGWEDRYLALARQKPVIVIWGDKDPFIPTRFGFAERMAQGQEVHRFKNIGHWIAAEIPNEFTHLLLNFLHGLQETNDVHSSLNA